MVCAPYPPEVIANTLEPNIEHVPVRFCSVTLDGCEQQGGMGPDVPTAAIRSKKLLSEIIDLTIQLIFSD